MQSLEALIKYFFAHDHLNYARMLPLYMSTMQETEKDHPEIWVEFVKGNFCVTKGMAGFTSMVQTMGSNKRIVNSKSLITWWDSRNHAQLKVTGQVLSRST